MTNVYGIEVFSWNPLRSSNGEPAKPVDNFGDLLGPLLVRNEVEARWAGRGQDVPQHAPSTTAARLLAVGSTLHFAADGDVVWGSGVNGKIHKDKHAYSRLDVRAVRGPLTGQWLEQNKSIPDPGVYGDPALLLLKAVPQLSAMSQNKRRRLSVIPNLNDFDRYASDPNVINPQGSVLEILGQLAHSEVIATSSLHGLVVGELLGIPTALFRPAKENLLKYEDYIRGTGRKDLVCYADVSEAVQALDTRPGKFAFPLADWDPSPLEAAFPIDLWAGPHL